MCVMAGKRPVGAAASAATASPRTLRRLVRLTTDRERDDLRVALQLSKTADVTAIVAVLRTKPRYEALRMVLGVASATLGMLQEIAAELETLNASARTNLSLVFLDGTSGERRELVLGRQLSAKLAVFNPDALAPPPRSERKLGELWPAVDRALDRVLAAGRIRAGRPQDRKGTGVWTRTPRIDDPRGRFVQREVATRLEKCLPGLADLSAPNGVALHRAAVRFLGSLRQSINGFSTVDPGEPARFASWQRDREIAAGDLRRVMHEDGSRAFDALAEAALLRGQITNARSTADLLAANLWTRRDQLFEIWVLTRVVSVMRSFGYSFEPLGVSETDDERTWQLSYARASHPCGVFKSTKVEGYLFYQLYRAGRGAMPDIALLETKDPKSRVIWTMDPKHSDRHGYTLSSYRGTATRYVRAFPKSSCTIVEHFDRADLNASNPHVLGAQAVLVHDVAPGRPGAARLAERLAAMHPQPALLCVDLSASFAPAIDGAVAALARWLEQTNARLLPKVVAFAGSAREINLPSPLSAAAFNAEDAGLESGTKLAPLLKAVAALDPPWVVLLTDGEFEDEGREAALASLRASGRRVTVLGSPDMSDTSTVA
jgi:hypothetical protein